jgi:hypothetical protein
MPHAPDRDGAFARLMVCGLYHLDSDYLGLREDFLDHIRVVAVSCRTHRAYGDRLPGVPGQVMEELDPDDDRPGAWAGRSVSEFFNINLATMLNLPEEPDEYVVYATLGRYVSNVVRIRLEAR